MANDYFLKTLRRNNVHAYKNIERLRKDATLKNRFAESVQKEGKKFDKNKDRRVQKLDIQTIYDMQNSNIH